MISLGEIILPWRNHFTACQLSGIGTLLPPSATSPVFLRVHVFLCGPVNHKVHVTAAVMESNGSFDGIERWQT